MSQIHFDWTYDDTGRANSSEAFLAAVKEVELCIRNGTGLILNPEWAQSTARLVVAHLAHGLNLAPSDHPIEEMYQYIGGTFRSDIVGCARCHGDGHENMEWLPLTHHFEAGGRLWTHWAPCPTNGEPILMANIKSTDVK